MWRTRDKMAIVMMHKKVTLEISPVDWRSVHALELFINPSKAATTSKQTVAERRRVSCLKDQTTHIQQQKVKRTLMVACFLVSTSSAFFLAKLPQSKKTTPLRCSLMRVMAAFVKLCQPYFSCELAACSLNVDLGVYQRLNNVD